MTEHTTPRHTPKGRGVFGALLLSAVCLAGPAHADTTAAKPGANLQSLAELDGKAPSRRNLDIKTWNTAEGAKVLFVEAHELPMFDLRLTFAAGSSQDGNLCQ